jgi:hypothetical protein
MRQCKAALQRKHILQDALCDICGAQEEDADHIVSRCPFARAFWRRIGWRLQDIAPVTQLWTTCTPSSTPRAAASPLILLYCWELWKHRHDVVFRHLPPDVNRLVATCKETIRS